jgi:hypothetical protein
MAGHTRRRLIGFLSVSGLAVIAGWRWWGFDSTRAEAASTEVPADPGTTSTTRPTSATSPAASSVPTSSSTAPTTTTQPVVTASTAGPVSPTSGTAGTGGAAPTSSTEGQVATNPTSIVAMASVVVIERAGWLAAEPTGGYSPHALSRMTVHHSAAAAAKVSGAPGRVRGYQAFHQKDRGWVDLAYHFIIDRSGNVYEGRPVDARGDTATSYDPTGHLLPCLDGDYDSQEPTDAQMAALAGLLAWGAVAFGLDPLEIRGHRDWAATSCPGNTVYRRMDALRTAVTAQVRVGGSTLAYLRGQAALDRVSGIEGG